MSADLAAQSKRLRAQTCQLLGLNPDDLTPAQQLRVNRASALRLQIDDLEAAQLRGQPIDISKLIAASEALERLLGGDPEAAARPDFTRAHEELNNLLIQRAERIEAREAEALRAVREREEQAAIAAALPVAAPVALPPPQSTPAPAAQPSNVAYLPSRTTDGRPSSHYLKDGQPREPWDYGGSDGVLIAPAWSPPGYK